MYLVFVQWSKIGKWVGRLECGSAFSSSIQTYFNQVFFFNIHNCWYCTYCFVCAYEERVIPANPSHHTRTKPCTLNSVSGLGLLVCIPHQKVIFSRLFTYVISKLHASFLLCFEFVDPPCLHLLRYKEPNITRFVFVQETYTFTTYILVVIWRRFKHLDVLRRS